MEPVEIVNMRNGSQFHSVPQALAYLSRLGSSQRIADELEKRGIRSKPGCPESCALSDFITESVGVYVVYVDGDDAAGFYDEVLERPFRHELPDAAHRFVIDFDSGEYPTLIARQHLSVLTDRMDDEELAA